MGEAVDTMHDTIIQEVGTFPSLLKVGDNQKMVYSKYDKGLFWVKPIERLKTKYDLIQDGSIIKDKTKIELLIDLRKIGVDTTSRPYLKEELIVLCNSNNIPIYTTTTRTENGWSETPKGMLQILYER